ncbi:zinc finger, CCHC-type containing protein [Tanacetum coccineum]|uniref:Zinc finger, CCHC-type containing protein n=1 Tax=Tanacetum coccineum TaxID=301880 RepID=A0ABQ5J1Y9_9ASTR
MKCWKYGKTGHFKRDCRSGKKNNANVVVRERGLRTNPKTKVDAIAWWIDSGATTHVCKDRCWFKTYEPVEDGYVLYMGDDHFAPIHEKGIVVLEFSSGKSITMFNVLYVSKLCKNFISGPVSKKCGYKQVYESDKSNEGHEDSVMSSASTVTYTSVYTDSEPGRVFWGANEELSDGVPSDVEAPLEDQPLPADALPTALSPGYVADSDPDEDPKEDPEEDHADYPADKGDGDDKPSDDDDDDDTDDEDEEPFEDEEEEHLALADSSAIPVVDPVPSAGDTEEFKTDESAPTPRSPQIRIPFS